MLTQLCLNLKVMKSQLAGDEELDLYQLGDLLVLWRQPTKQSDHLSAAAVISNDYPELMGALRHTSLDCQFLFGNHDLMLYGSDDYLAWNWRYYVQRDPTAKRNALILHGDIFDWLEKLPPAPRAAIVSIFGGYHRTGKWTLESAMSAMRRHVRALHEARSYQDYIQNASPAQLGLLDSELEPTRDRINVQTADSAVSMGLQYLEFASSHCRELNQENPEDLDLRLVVIGHTHHARIAVRESKDGEFLALMDCGAWIEWCRMGNGELRPNAQLGVLSANDLRIYQLED